MIKCSMEAYITCPHGCTQCGSYQNAFFLDGSECDKYNQTVGKVVSQISEILPQITSELMEILPQITSGLMEILPQVVDKCVDYLQREDVVQIVRCKDCKNWQDGYFGYCTKIHSAMHYDGFCSNAERRE